MFTMPSTQCVLQIKYLLNLEHIEIRDCEKYYEWTETLYRVNGIILVQYTQHFLLDKLH